MNLGRDVFIFIKIFGIWFHEYFFKPKIPPAILKGRSYYLVSRKERLPITVFMGVDNSLLIRFDKTISRSGPEGISITYPENSTLELGLNGVLTSSDRDEKFLLDVCEIFVSAVEHIEIHPADSNHFIVRRI